MKKCIIFDLDWTLCELKRYPDKNRHTWNENPIKHMCAIFSSIAWIEKIILTGRKSTYREVTRQWIETNIWTAISLIMQEKKTADKNHIFKKEQLEKLKKEYEIIAMYDDNPDMIPVCEELKIPLILC